MRDDSAEILFQSFLQEALVSSSGMDSDVHSLMLSTIQHFLCRPGVARPPVCLKDDFGEVVEACDMPNYASFCLLKVARRGSCGPTRKFILLRTQLLVLCSK